MATRLKYNIGTTINLGNFQSARVDVGMEKDIEGDGSGDHIYPELLENYMDEIKDWCGRELMKQVKQIKEGNNVK